MQVYARFSELQSRNSCAIRDCSTSDKNTHTFQLLGFVYDGFLRYTCFSEITLWIPYWSLNIKSVVMFAKLWKIFTPPHSASVCGSTPRVWLHFDFIFVVLKRGNVMLNIAISPFVRMTLQSRPSCGENLSVCGNR